MMLDVCNTSCNRKSQSDVRFKDCTASCCPPSTGYVSINSATVNSATYTEGNAEVFTTSWNSLVISIRQHNQTSAEDFHLPSNYSVL